MSAEILLSRLEAVKPGQRPGEYWAKCPAHDDKTPSLHITEISDGTILIHDFGGCSPAEVLGAVGLELGDLFPDRIEPCNNVTQPRRRSRPYVNPRDLLRLLLRSATIVWIASEDIANGKSLTPVDKRILNQAWGDMGRILQGVDL